MTSINQKVNTEAIGHSWSFTFSPHAQRVKAHDLAGEGWENKVTMMKKMSVPEILALYTFEWTPSLSFAAFVFFFLNSEWTHNHWFASSNSQRYFNARCAFGGHEADEEKCVCAVVWSFSGLFKKKNYFLGRNGLVNNFSLLQQIKYDCDSCLFKAMIGNVASIMHFQIIFISWVSCTWYFMYSIDFIHLIIMIHYCYYFRIKIVGSG